MKFTIGKENLLEGLQAVQNVVGVRSTLPILSNALIEAQKDKLYFTTTNLDVTVRCAVEADVAKTGATTLPVRRLFGIVREFPDAPIQIEVDDKDTATVSCESSVFKIIGLSQEEFPPPPKADGQYAYKVEQHVFKEMLKMTHYAASTDETRYTLNGVLLSFKEGKLVVVATDGRRLALTEHEVEVPKEAEADIILPSKAVAELTHTLRDEGELRIMTKANQILFQFDNVFMASKVIEGSYPNYRQVIPSECEQRVTVERESLLTALRRVSLLITEKSNAMRLSFTENRLVITMNTPEVGDVRETLPIKYTGKELEVAFNPEFMLDPLRNLTTDEIHLEITDEMSPGVIKCNMPFLYVLMPMRIG